MNLTNVQPKIDALFPRQGILHLYINNEMLYKNVCATDSIGIWASALLANEATTLEWVMLPRSMFLCAFLRDFKIWVFHSKEGGWEEGGSMSRCVKQEVRGGEAIVMCEMIVCFNTNYTFIREWNKLSGQVKGE